MKDSLIQFHQKVFIFPHISDLFPCFHLSLSRTNNKSTLTINARYCFVKTCFSIAGFTIPQMHRFLRFSTRTTDFSPPRKIQLHFRSLFVHASARKMRTEKHLFSNRNRTGTPNDIHTRGQEKCTTGKSFREIGRKKGDQQWARAETRH